MRWAPYNPQNRKILPALRGEAASSKKTTSQVAEETFHSPEEVEYYVQSLRRVLVCLQSGMSEAEIATATGRSLSLVREYLELIRDFNLAATT